MVVDILTNEHFQCSLNKSVDLLLSTSRPDAAYYSYEKIRILRYFSPDQTKDFIYPKGVLIDVGPDSIETMGFLSEFSDLVGSFYLRFKTDRKIIEIPKFFDVFDSFFDSVKHLHFFSMLHGKMSMKNIIFSK
ncbi:hypothetical protein MDAP_002500 [Mitosporidium daphniae]